MEGGLQTLQKRMETKGKCFFKTLFQLRMALKNGQKQGRGERMQEDYPTFAVYFCSCRVVFLRSFISALFCPFFRAMLN